MRSSGERVILFCMLAGRILGSRDAPEEGLNALRNTSSQDARKIVSESGIHNDSAGANRPVCVCA